MAPGAYRAGAQAGGPRSGLGSHRDAGVTWRPDVVYNVRSEEFQVSRAASAGTSFFFSHVAVDGRNSLTFTMSESATLDSAFYRLSVEAEFGIHVPDATFSIGLSEGEPTTRSSGCDVNL